MKRKQWDGKCPSCGSDKYETEREGSTDIVIVTCKNCHKVFYLTEERKYFLTDRDKI
jgi:hypothetical protein